MVRSATTKLGDDFGAFDPLFDTLSHEFLVGVCFAVFFKCCFEGFLNVSKPDVYTQCSLAV